MLTAELPAAALDASRARAALTAALLGAVASRLQRLPFEILTAEFAAAENAYEIRIPFTAEEAGCDHPSCGFGRDCATVRSTDAPHEHYSIWEARSED